MEQATRVDLPEAIVIVFDLVVGAQQPAWNSLRLRDGSAVAAQVAHGKCGQHLLEDIVQVRARRHRGDVGLEMPLVARRIGAVEVGIVKVGALDAPHLVVHLRPLFGRIHAHTFTVMQPRFSAPSPGFTGAL